jgi:hypothetical protein
MTGRLALALVAVTAAACTERRTVGQPSFSVVNQNISLIRRDQVDILFMIDNSSSETGQFAFQSDFGELFSRIRGLASEGVTASYHIGVIDSDMGAAGDLQACAKPGGDGGKLLTGPGPQSSVPAPADCAGLALPDPFIDYNSATGVSNTGTLAVPDAFQCISAVGDQGCGFEAQFEAIHQALTPGVNPGFLRDDALLVVMMLTDEDDCSAPPDTTLFADSPGATAQWGVLQSFRCTQWGIACNGTPLDGTALAPTSDCVPIVGGPLYDVSRYISLFRAGGVKASADDLILAAIAAPPTPFGVTVTMPCAAQLATASCPSLEHSCINSTNASFSGDPGVRIAAVTNAVPGAINSDICHTDYSDVMDAVADQMTARMLGGCLPGTVVDPTACTVSVGGVDTALCNPEAPSPPCWNIVEDNGCPAHPTPAGAMESYRFVVEGAPAGAVVDAVCPLYEPPA